MPRGSIFILLFVLGVALGARLWFGLSAPAEPFAAYLDRAAVVEGTVSDDPDVRAAAVRVPLHVATINGVAAQGTILAVLAPGSRVEYGDTLVVRGLLEAP